MVLTYSQGEGYGPADLRKFNLRTGHRSGFPPVVNTAASESGATISGRYVLFTRQLVRADGDRRISLVLLFNRVTGHVTQLDRGVMVPGGYRDAPVGPVVSAGQVNGDYAVWSRVLYGDLSVRRSVVFRYHIPTGVATLIPRLVGTLDRSPAVSADGTMFFFRRFRHDTARADMMRQPLEGSAELFWSLPPDEGAATPFVDDQDGTHRVYFAMTGDDNYNQFNTYRVDDPPPATP